MCQCFASATPPSPVFSSFACAFGLALGELAIALDKPEEIERVLWRAYVEAKASFFANTLRRSLPTATGE